MADIEELAERAGNEFVKRILDESDNFYLSQATEELHTAFVVGYLAGVSQTQRDYLAHYAQTGKL